MNTCWCGCNELVNRYYVPGHDQRHLQAVIRTRRYEVDPVNTLLEFPTQAMRDRFVKEVSNGTAR